jgi:protein-S-isoprenylcysteine O-methyltransferase Ste14
MPEMDTTRLIEGLFSLIIFGMYLVLWKRKRRQQRSQTGIDPEVLFRDTRPSQRLFSSLSRIMTVSIGMLIGLHVAGISEIPGFYRVNALHSIWSDLIGLLVAISGLGLCYLAQQTMGNAWRVGIDSEHKSNLVTHGIFRLIRNPTYSGLLIMCLGIVLILPTFSIVTWVLLFFLMIEFQVRLEEEYLLELHKNEYRDYLTCTKRYIPFIY